MSDIEYSVIASDVIKSFDCIKIKSERINICTKFSICRWMKWLKLTFQIGLENGQKSVKSQGILKTILSGNPVRPHKRKCIWSNRSENFM